MQSWITYGLLSAMLVSICDLLRKYLVNNISPMLTVILPLSVSGVIALIYLIREDFKIQIKHLDKKDYCILLIIGLLIPVGHYLITKSLQTVHNPGYAKTIISLNVIISLFASIFLFSTAKVNKYTVFGVFLVIIGTYLITTKYNKFD